MPFAGESDQVLMATAVAFDPQEAMFEPSATQVILELVEHEAGKISLMMAKFILQAGQMLLDDRV